MKWNVWRFVITISEIQLFGATSNDFLNHEQVVVTNLRTIFETYFETGKPNYMRNITNVTTRTLLDSILHLIANKHHFPFNSAK